MRKRWWLFAPLAILGIVLVIGIAGEIVMQLWNWLVPPVFGWHTLTFWQAAGLLALCRILFGGVGRHGYARSRFRHRMSERMAARWEGMSPEERERFREGLRGRCGFDPGPAPARDPSKEI